MSGLPYTFTSPCLLPNDVVPAKVTEYSPCVSPRRGVDFGEIWRRGVSFLSWGREDASLAAPTALCAVCAASAVESDLTHDGGEGRDAAGCAVVHGALYPPCAGAALVTLKNGRGTCATSRGFPSCSARRVNRTWTLPRRSQTQSRQVKTDLIEAKPLDVKEQDGDGWCTTTRKERARRFIAFCVNTGWMNGGARWRAREGYQLFVSFLAQKDAWSLVGGACGRVFTNYAPLLARSLRYLDPEADLPCGGDMTEGARSAETTTSWMAIGGARVRCGVGSGRERPRRIEGLSGLTDAKLKEAAVSLRQCGGRGLGARDAGY
ncbi:hypothetical protein C8R47DRAFT_252381 [Mycena vitilis]|nr:hypothetical protein C8R47DRAFT_252381 [Mycena vitilis]